MKSLDLLRSADDAVRMVRLFLRYPSAVPHLLSGVSSTVAYIDGLVKEEYSKRPIEIKRANGFDIYLNPEDNYMSPLIGITGTYEPEVTRIFKMVLKEGDTVIDIGANVGWFTLLAARTVGETGRVISFEPDPENFALLTKSVQRNEFPNVVLFKEAVSDIDGIRRLNLNGSGNSGAHSIVRDFGGGSIPVQSSKLETVAERLNLDLIDLIKVDTEGAEPQVVSGMRSLIDDGKVLRMIIEWNPKEWGTSSELLSLLFETFHVYRVNHLSLAQLTGISRETLPLSQANLYLVKK